MRKPGHIIVATVAGLFIAPSLVACSQMRSDITEVTEVAPPPEQATSSHEAPRLGPGLQRLADIAKSDLQTKLGIDAKDIDIVEAAYVTWRDSSIGCPRPGMQYMQVLTNGARIVLRANGVLYHYHSGGNRAPFHCAKPSPTEPLPYTPGEA